jgi:hypothetical protein
MTFRNQSCTATHGLYLTRSSTPCNTVFIPLKISLVYVFSGPNTMSKKPPDPEHSIPQKLTSVHRSQFLAQSIGRSLKNSLFKKRKALTRTVHPNRKLAPTDRFRLKTLKIKCQGCFEFSWIEKASFFAVIF